MLDFRDPAVVEEEKRREEEARQLAIRERHALYHVAWEQLYRYFQFKDVKWMADKFFAAAVADNVLQPGHQTKASQLLEAEGHPKLEVIISKKSAYGCVKQWLEKRYGRDGTNKEVKSGEPEELAASKSGVDVSKERWEFQDVVAFTSAYANVHVEFDPQAGFGPRDVDQFKARFDAHRGSAPGLKPAKLWALLKECGLSYEKVEEQKYVLKVLDEVDANKNGELDGDELMHLLRRLLDGTRVESRQREHELLTHSGMPLNEAEDWFGIYIDACKARAGEEGQPSPQVSTDDFISIGDVKAVFEGKLGLKIEKNDTAQMKKFLQEVDTDFNGQIDFGEFVSLVQKMWDVDFAGIATMLGGGGGR